MFVYRLEALRRLYPDLPVMESREKVPEDFTLKHNSSSLPVMGVLAFISNVRGAVVFTLENRGLLGQVWNLPGGSPEEGESFEDAVRREILEETGLSIESLAPVLIYDKTYYNDRLEGKIIFLVFRADNQAYQRLNPQDPDVLQAEWFYQMPHHCLDQDMVRHLWNL